MASTIIERLRSGYEPGPLFDARSRLAYVLTIGASALGAALFMVRGLRLDPPLAVGPIWAGIAVISGWVARRGQFPKVAAALETTGLVYGQAFAFLFLIYALMTFNVPLADAPLAQADRVIGFYWPTLAEQFRRNDNLTDWSKIIYMSFNWEPGVVAITLCALDRQDRAWRFVTAATVSLCITAMIGTLVLPAEGTVVYFHTGSWPNLVSAWRQSQAINALRSGRHLIDQSMMAGLISFPSYHACSAALFAWALWPVRHVRWPAIVLNVAVSFVAIVLGAHYLVDIFAGVIVAGISVKVADRERVKPCA